MRLWIDVREACRPRKTGKGQWTLRCVVELLRHDHVKATLLTDGEIPREWKGLPGLSETKILSHRGLWWHIAVWRLLLRERHMIDAYVSPTSFIVPFLIGRCVLVVPVIHDLIALRGDAHDSKAAFIERLTLPRALRTAASLCTVSDATARALRERFPSVQATHTVHAGPTTAESHTWTGVGDYVLCVGTLCPRKNQLRLIRAFSQMNVSGEERMRLLLVGGRGWHDELIVRSAKETPGVEWLGFQSDDAVATLLRECRAFAYVSEEEGFGFPVLDALRVGAPVLASDIPSAREVAGDCATYVDPFNTDVIAHGLSAVLRAGPVSAERADRQTSLYSWPETAKGVLAACAAAVDKRR